MVGIIACMLMLASLLGFLVEVPFAIPLATQVSWTSLPQPIHWGVVLSVLLWVNNGFGMVMELVSTIGIPLVSVQDVDMVMVIVNLDSLMCCFCTV